MGTGEHIAHHARMPCPRARAFARPRAARLMLISQAADAVISEVIHPLDEITCLDAFEIIIIVNQACEPFYDDKE